jgi:uncharacterized membrane protein
MGMVISYLFILLLIHGPANLVQADVEVDTCDIVGLYKAQSFEVDTFIKTSYGEIEDAIGYEVLVKMKIQSGDYSESVSRVSSNFYKVQMKNIYIRTRACYEYAYGQEAYIKINNYQGYTFGELTFK